MSIGQAVWVSALAFVSSISVTSLITDKLDDSWCTCTSSCIQRDTVSNKVAVATRVWHWAQLLQKPCVRTPNRSTRVSLSVNHSQSGISYTACTVETLVLHIHTQVDHPSGCWTVYNNNSYNTRFDIRPDCWFCLGIDCSCFRLNRRKPWLHSDCRKHF